MAEARLTYCGNVHPAEDLGGWLHSVETHALPVARSRRAAGLPFGLGAWWNARVAAELAGDEAARARVRAKLAEWDLPVWTLNVFPFGSFHGERVKEAVYQPDWSTEERVLYTRHAAEAVGALAAEGAVVPMSTLPLGYSTRDLRLCARNLVRAASHLAAVAERTGRTAVLALEPEPFCVCETVRQTADFLEEWVFRPGASAVPESVLRRHLGVCVDLCHLAVVDEDPVAALAELERRGIAVPKIQVSSCLELRRPADALDELLGFDEPRYLHQTVATGGARALDLPEVRRRRAEFAAAARVRTHFHLPVFWDADGPLGSTRKELERVLPGLAEAPGRPLLEVETYTWSVLDAAWRPDRDLVRGIEQELDFVGGLIRR